MRRSPYSQRFSKPGAALRMPEPPKRKEFSCIVDDSALIAGVKKSTRDGIRKWVSQGSIRLHVPLHTLTQLHRLKKGNERIHADAREAVKWLDEVTSMPDVEAAHRVQLEGVDEVYPTWAEAKRFLLPDTLLSMEDSESDVDDDDDDDDEYHEDLESSFNALDVSDETSMSSTHSLDDQPKGPESYKSFTTTDSKQASEVGYREQTESLPVGSLNDTTCDSTEKESQNAVPVYLRPLFNHIIWRINREENPNSAFESFILLTNDPFKQAIAQKFGVRAKRLEQLRDAVAREDREFKNHLTMHKLEIESIAADSNPSTTTPKVAERPKSRTAAESKPEQTSDDEDVVLFQRAPRGPAAATANNQRVFDPHEFERANQHLPQHSSRAGHPPSRCRGGPTSRGRGSFAPRGAYVAPGPAFRASPASRHDPNQPIDPNSFARPFPKASPVRGGGRRKLWEPN